MQHNPDFTLRHWLDAYFDHPYEYGNFLYLDELPISPEQHLNFVTQTFNNADTLLKPYSNGQIKQTLWLLASELHDLSDKYGKDINWDIRQHCIQSFISLNQKLFAQRCAPETSAYKTIAPDNPLNTICYMWWDIFAFWESLDEQSTNRVDAEFLSVMVACLDIQHIAVLEGALHGLSHIPNHRQQVESHITAFLKKQLDLPENLITYARAAIRRANL